MKRIVVDLTLDKQMLQDVLKKALRCHQRRQLARMLLTEYRVSERRACAIVLLDRTVYRYVGRPRDDRGVRQRIKEMTTTRAHFANHCSCQ